MYAYTHIEAEIETVGALINRKDHKLFKGIKTSKEFLDYKYPADKLDTDSTPDEQGTPTLAVKGKTNWDRLEKKYGDVDSQRYIDNKKRYDEADYDGVEIPINSLMYVPEDKVTRDSGLIAQDATAVKPTTFKAFIAQELDDLFQNTGYKQVIDRGSGGINVVSNRGVTAYMWIRSAGDDNSGGEWVNVSAFIHNQSTFVGSNGGNFSLDLAPIVAGYEYGKWVLDDGSIQGIESGQFNDAYSATSFIHTVEQDLLRRNKFFFHTAIQANDLVYIKFEDLESDHEVKSTGANFHLSPEEVARHNWDMIGMVDNVPQVVNSQDNNVLIRVTGRDLVKAFIDDETIFFPDAYAGAMFANGTNAQDGKLAKRLNGTLMDMNTHVDTSIEFNLKFILNQLSNTGYVSNNAFRGYDLAVLSKINRNQMMDIASFGSLVSVKDRFGGKKIEIPGTAALEESDGIWKIVKLIIDKSVRDRRLSDSSVFASQGSMLNFVRKICQAPLVEFMTDTYGKQFYLTARKPPFDAEGLKSLVYDVGVAKDTSKIEGYGKVIPTVGKVSIPSENPDLFQGQTLDPDAVTVTASRIMPPEYTLSNLTLTIEEGVVFNENLQYETEAYSWYYYNPRGLTAGVTNDYQFALIKAVQFDEYVDVWGSKPLQYESNYTRFNDYSDSGSDKSILRYENQALQDLKYIVDSNAYLPFTRKGTITIHGDRRFKRGMFCLYQPTNEVFYIDSVQQRRDITNNSIDRVTTLQVSRGMVEPYIKGLDGMSYFNIINTNAPDVVTTGQANKILSTWAVNKDVFDFFLSRKQWVSPDLLSLQGIVTTAKNALGKAFGGVLGGRG